MVCWSGRELRNTTPNFLIMTTIITEYNNTELLDQELNFDELQEINGAVAPLIVAGIAGGAALAGFITGVIVRHYCSD